MILAGRHVQYHVCEQEREQKLRDECDGDFPPENDTASIEGGIYDHARGHRTQQPAYDLRPKVPQNVDTPRAAA